MLHSFRITTFVFAAICLLPSAQGIAQHCQEGALGEVHTISTSEPTLKTVTLNARIEPRLHESIFELSRGTFTTSSVPDYSFYWLRYAHSGEFLDATTSGFQSSLGLRLSQDFFRFGIFGISRPRSTAVEAVVQLSPDTAQVESFRERLLNSPASLSATATFRGVTKVKHVVPYPQCAHVLRESCYEVGEETAQIRVDGLRGGSLALDIRAEASTAERALPLSRCR